MKRNNNTVNNAIANRVKSRARLYSANRKFQSPVLTRPRGSISIIQWTANIFRRKNEPECVTCRAKASLILHLVNEVGGTLSESRTAKYISIIHHRLPADGKTYRTLRNIIIVASRNEMLLKGSIRLSRE